MKLRMIAGALLIMILALGMSTKADAAWRGCYGRGCYRPVVRVCAPRVVVGGYYGGYYGRAHYCGPRYYARGCGGYRHCR